ncbi:TPA: Ig-like domain-containing protein, partial [Vibrio alginolyticus]
MSKFFKGLFVLLGLPLLVLLSGCNSEGAFSEPQESSKLERIDILASPIATRGVSEVTLAKGNQQSFEAFGYYSDGSSQQFTDLSELDWHSSDGDVASFETSGVLVGIEEGSTTITATKDGVTSNEVTVA